MPESRVPRGSAHRAALEGTRLLKPPSYQEAAGERFHTLAVWNIAPTEATCEVKANQLAPVAVEQSPKSGEAIIPE